MKYNKLVRDRIPEIIRQKKGEPFVYVATKKEYWQKLKEKLKEEAEEFIKKENKEELVDILEIIDAICDFKRFDKKKLLMLKTNKARARGGFKKRIILVES